MNQMRAPRVLAKGARRPTNLSLSEALVGEARALGVNLSRAAELGVATEVARVRAQQWIERNRAAMESWNDYVAENGLPLEDLRLF